MASFWLEYRENGQSQEFDFDGHSVTVGRDKSSDFVLDHPTVSRQHAVIVFKNGSFYLVVLSRGGMTAIDGRQVDGEVMLYDGQSVHLGQLQFEFHSHQAPQKSASPHPSSNQAGGGGSSAKPAGFGANAGPGFGGPNQPGSAQAGGPGNPSQFGASATQGGPAASASQGQRASAGFGPPDNSGTQNLDEQADAQADSSNSGIISWDEIANSSAAADDDDAQKNDSVYERMQQAKQDESTNPVVVGVAGVAIAGLLYFVLFTGGGDAAQQTVEKPADEQEPVHIDVECIGKTECLQKAEESYAVAVAALDNKGAAISRLFDGYKGLLETQTYLDKAGTSSAPAKMADLTARKQKARKALTKIFNRERLDFHNAKRASQYKTMARTLDQIKQYFPDRSARENRWARDNEKRMRKQHIYPAHVYPDY